MFLILLQSIKQNRFSRDLLVLSGWFCATKITHPVSLICNNVVAHPLICTFLFLLCTLAFSFPKVAEKVSAYNTKNCSYEFINIGDNT